MCPDVNLSLPHVETVVYPSPFHGEGLVRFVSRRKEEKILILTVQSIYHFVMKIFVANLSICHDGKAFGGFDIARDIACTVTIDQIGDPIR